MVSVTLDHKTMLLPVVVMDVKDSPLFGVPWMTAFGLKLPRQVEVGAVKSNTQKVDGNISMPDKLNGVLKEYSAIFKNELGTTGVYAKVYLKDGIKPISFTARRVPFPLKRLVETELRRLEEIGIIEKVDPGVTPIEWSTPTVNVHK